MSEFLSFAERLKDLGSTVLIVGAAIFLTFRYLPSLMKQQGVTDEVIRNCTATIANNTETLRVVTARDAETRESLDRIEKHIDEIKLDVHDIKHDQKHRERTER